MAEIPLDAPVEIKLSTEQFYEDWAKITIDKLQQALAYYNIDPESNLGKSITKEVTKNNGDVSAVFIRFAKYGRFVDMGVGRGVPIGLAGTKQFSKARNANGQLKKYSRKPKPWYSGTYFKEVQKLKELFYQKFGEEVPVQIREALTIEINLTA